ncbi:hypothetical protein V2J09_023981 [Rumex salicifolius]
MLQAREASVLRKCSDTRILRQIHARLFTCYTSSDRVSLLYRLLSGYIVAGHTFYAQKVLCHLRTPKLLSINSMLYHFSGTKNLEKAAFPLYKILLARIRPRPNSHTLAFVLKACSEDLAFIEGEQVHAQSFRSGLSSNVFLQTALMNLYAKCGVTGSAHKVFDEITERNVVAWSTLISGYVGNGMVNEALGLFREMQLAGILPDEITMVSVISACAASGELDTGRWVHAYIDMCGIKGDIELSTALVNMYAKCGSIERAIEVFDTMPVKDTKAWSTIITGLAIHGLAEEALLAFSKMDEAKVRPNCVTFVGVLSACAHAGLVKEGKKHWSRIPEFGIEPSMELYGCMVDILCRGNLVEEAFNFVESMPIDPNPVILRTLLRSCKETRNVERGEAIAEQLLVLEPWNAGNYLLLCNLYASVMQWDKLRSVRQRMKENKIDVEVPGCSSIEVGGHVHEFLMGDWSHPESCAIRETLKEINENVELNCEQDLCSEEV